MYIATCQCALLLEIERYRIYIIIGDLHTRVCDSMTDHHAVIVVNIPSHSCGTICTCRSLTSQGLEHGGLLLDNQVGQAILSWRGGNKHFSV